MVVSGSFFGTDGIRGETSLAVVDEEEAMQMLEEQRTLTPAFMRVLGEALSHAQPAMPGTGETVVVGWDRRPHNPELVAALTLGLRLTGSRVVHVGECATPTLHHAVLAFGARMGCMITASHNPVSDSGIKVFDAYGYKSNPELEADISRTLRQLACEDREVDRTDLEAMVQPDEVHDAWAERTHRKMLTARWATLAAEFGGCAAAVDNGRIASPFLLDTAGGFGRTWLADFLTEHGVVTEDVSQTAVVLNEGCGAGDFSPTQTWSHEEARTSNHALIQRLTAAPAGRLVGAALDGDGDRCLFIEATETGFAVVDGDGMAARLMGAASSSAWRFAASIESDVALPGHVQSLDSSSSTHETAVGDRWLAYTLRPEDGGLLNAPTMPPRLGVEDSGHLILPAPHPLEEGTWSLVGDGAATLCAVLNALDRPAPFPFERGWKKRVSIPNTVRERWHNEAEVFEATHTRIVGRLSERWTKVERRAVPGEPHLLLMHAEANNKVASIGIRNSGTQAKTSLSIRLSAEVDRTPFEALMDELVALLTPVLCEA